MAELTEIAAGVFVTTSEFSLTISTVVAGAGGTCLVIDPGVTLAETAALAGALAARGLRPAVGWSTHPHWDHVLWHADLGDVPRYATPAAVEVMRTERDGLLDGMRRRAPGYDPALFGHATPLSEPAIGWDGPQALLIVHDAHAPGHGAVFLPDTGVLMAGDMLSDEEIPLLDTASDDAVGDYRTGLARLAAVRGVRQVVPGHGHVGDAAGFRRRVAADVAYLDTLALGEPFDDPRVPAAGWIRDAHEEHLRYVRAMSL